MICDLKCDLSLRMFHVHLRKKVYSAVLGWHVLKIPVRYSWSNVWLKTWIPSSIFCPDDLFISVSEVVKSLTIIVLLLISPFMVVNISLMYLDAHILSTWIFINIIFLLGLIPWDWSLDHCVMSFLIHCNSLSFKAYLVWYEYYYSCFLLTPICMGYLFPSPVFILYVSIDMKWIS